LIPGKKKGIKFRFSWTTDSFYLQMRGEDERLLDYLSQKLGKPNVKWTMHGWLGTYTMYAWEKQPERAKTLYDSLRFSEAMKSGIFSFLSHKDAQLLQS